MDTPSVRKGDSFKVASFSFFNIPPPRLCELVRKTFEEYGAENTEFFVFEHNEELIDGELAAEFKVTKATTKIIKLSATFHRRSLHLNNGPVLEGEITFSRKT